VLLDSDLLKKIYLKVVLLKFLRRPMEKIENNFMTCSHRSKNYFFNISPFKLINSPQSRASFNNVVKALSHLIKGSVVRVFEKKCPQASEKEALLKLT